MRQAHLVVVWLEPYDRSGRHSRQAGSWAPVSLRESVARPACSWENHPSFGANPRRSAHSQTPDHQKTFVSFLYLGQTRSPLDSLQFLRHLAGEFIELPASFLPTRTDKPGVTGNTVACPPACGKVPTVAVQLQVALTAKHGRDSCD